MPRFGVLASTHRPASLTSNSVTPLASWVMRSTRTVFQTLDHSGRPEDATEITLWYYANAPAPDGIIAVSASHMGGL
jgi:hypothetical protein